MRKVLQRRLGTLYIDPTIGSDSYLGMTKGAPFKTFAALSGKTLKVVSIAAGSMLVANAFAPHNGGASGQSVVFTTHGSGPKPILHNVPNPESSSSWSNVSGNIYSKTTASTYTGSSIWWVDNSGTITHLLKGTAGALTANQFNITSTTLQVNIGRAPASTDVFQIPQNTNQLVTIEGKNNITFQGISFRFSGSDGVQAAAATATDSVRLSQCELAWCASGLFHAGTGAIATNMVADSCWMHDQYNQQNAMALHCDVGPGSASALNTLFQRIAGHGTTSHDNATFLRYKCVYDGAQAFCVSGGQGGGVGVNTHIGCQWVNMPPEAADHSYHLDFASGATPPSASTIFNLYNCSFARGTGNGGGTGVLRALQAETGVWRVRNLALYGGYEIGLWGNNLATTPANGSLDSDYVFTGGANTNVFQWPAGAHDQTLASDPYNNVSLNDLSPKAGSVLLDAGGVVAGVTNSATPDVGYTGAR